MKYFRSDSNQMRVGGGETENLFGVAYTMPPALFLELRHSDFYSLLSSPYNDVLTSLIPG